MTKIYLTTVCCIQSLTLTVHHVNKSTQSYVSTRGILIWNACTPIRIGVLSVSASHNFVHIYPRIVSPLFTVGEAIVDLEDGW